MEPVPYLPLSLREVAPPPRDDDKGVTYAVARSVFTRNLEKQQQVRDRYWRCLGCDSPGMIALSALTITFVAFGIIFPPVLLTNNPEYASLIALPPLVYLGGIGGIYGVVKIVTAARERSARRQLALINHAIELGGSSRAIPGHHLLSMYLDGSFNIQQARALKIPFEKIPADQQQWVMMLNQVKMLSQQELKSSIMSHGFKAAVAYDASFLGEYIREVHHTEHFASLVDTFALRIFQLFPCDILDYTLVVKGLAEGLPLHVAFLEAEKMQLREIIIESHDITLQLNQQEIPASRRTLASASEFYEKMLMGPFSEANNALICIQVDGVDGDIAEAIIRYLHGERLVIDYTRFEQYFILAHMHQLSQLLERLENDLMEQCSKKIDVEVCLGLVMHFQLKKCIPAIDTLLTSLLMKEKFAIQESEIILSMSSSGFNKASGEARIQYLKALQSYSFTTFDSLNAKLIEATRIASMKEDEYTELPFALCSMAMSAKPERFREWVLYGCPELSKWMRLYALQPLVVPHWFPENLSPEEFYGRLHEFAALGSQTQSYEELLAIVAKDLPKHISGLYRDRQHWSEVMTQVWMIAADHHLSAICDGYFDYGRNVSSKSLSEFCELLRSQEARKLLEKGAFSELFWSNLASWILSPGGESILALAWDIRAEFPGLILDFCKKHPSLCRKVWTVLPQELDAFMFEPQNSGY